MLESLKDPINMLFGGNDFSINVFLEEFQNLNGDHFSEQLCLRILRAVPQHHPCDPWLIQRIAIRLAVKRCWTIALIDGQKHLQAMYLERLISRKIVNFPLLNT